MINKISRRDLLLFFMIIIGLFLFIVAYYTYPTSEVKPELITLAAFRIELAKSLLQLGSIAIVGGSIATFIKYYLDKDLRDREIERQETQRKLEMERQDAQRNLEIERQDTQRRLDLYYDFIERSGNAYREAKACRRRLRSIGLTEKFGPHPEVLSTLQWDKYGTELLTLNDIQLRLEQLKIEARARPELVTLLRDASGSPETAYNQLKSMEKYLGGIVGEFEKVFGTHTSPVSFSKLKKLSEFTDGKPHVTENGPFDKEFADAHGRLIEILQSAISHLASSKYASGDGPG
jgi:hypothetical protein